jgi:chemotaxis signal transduction protein
MKTLHTELQNTELQPRKFVVFTIAGYRLALPIEHVVRVINYSAQINPELNKLGLLQIGSHTIRLVNFSQQVPLPENFSENLTENLAGNLQLSRTPPFLMIARDLQGAICGIPLDQPPDLIEIPIEKIQLLPQSDRHPAALQTASHVAIISQDKDVTTTIFLLKGIDG